MKVKSESEALSRVLATPWSLPGSFVHGIFQARVLEWGAIAFSAKEHMLLGLLETLEKTI